MKLFNCAKKISPFIVIALLSACSNTQTNSSMSKLQSDFDQYKYSSYVSANLRPEANVAVENVINTNSINTKQMALAKRQLDNSKQKSSNKIANTIRVNGIYQTTKRADTKVLTTFATLENVLAIALQNNLDIQTAKQQVIASLAKYDQVGFLEDMLSQYAAFTGTKKPAQFPFPGLLALKSSIIDQSVETARLKLKQKVQDVITQTRLAYYEMQFIQAEMSLIKQDIGILKSLKKELQNNYASNTGDLDGVLQVDIDLAKSRNNLQSSKDKFNSQQSRLNAKLNLSTDFKIGKLDKIKQYNFKLVANRNYLATAQKNRIEIAILQSELAQMEKVIQLSQKRFYPDLDAGFSRIKKGQFSTRPMIKTNAVFGKDDAYLTETREKVKALKSNIAALKTKTAGDVQQLISKHQIASKNLKLYQNRVIPKSKVSLEVAKNMYETGESNYAKVLKVKKTILNYRLAALNAQIEMLFNKAKLMRLVANE